MKPLLSILFGSILLAAIACGSPATPISDSVETSAPTATPTSVPTRAPTTEPTATKTPVPTSASSATKTAAPTSTESGEPTPTKTLAPETIAEAARTTNPGVPIVKRGDLGAQAKEKITVQLAIDSMMVANLMASVTPNDDADYIRAEGVPATDTDFGGGQTLVGSTRTPITTYCYTWDSNGTILSQLEPGTPPCGATP